MKYIRTTNGIYQSDSSHINKITEIEENGEEHPCLEISLDYSCFFMTRNERIIDESDNIEELCDEFVIDCKSNIKHKPFIYTLPKNIKEYYNSLKTTKKDTTVYGAIWTDKGLIYVAKMNDKKEFELV